MLGQCDYRGCTNGAKSGLRTAKQLKLEVSKKFEYFRNFSDARKIILEVYWTPEIYCSQPWGGSFLFGLWV